MRTAKKVLCKEEQRLRRQIAIMSRRFPRLERFVDRLLDPKMRHVRLPLGILLILAGFVGFLPVLGFWMLPLGLLLLALDVPMLRPPLAAAMIRMRRLLRRWWPGNRGG